MSDPVQSTSSDKIDPHNVLQDLQCLGRAQTLEGERGTGNIHTL